MHRFDRDTAVTPLEAPEPPPAEVRGGAGPTPGATRTFEARIDRGWWILRGPNGGYVAAILLRAMQAAVGDDARAPRSLTVHYTSPPAEGAARVETRLERAGRSLSTVTARLLQEGRLKALAVGAFSRPREGPELRHARRPEVPPPEAIEPLALDAPPEPGALTLRERFDSRPAVGPSSVGSGDKEALAGGWMRLAEGPRPLDPPLAATLTDAWPPSVFSWTPPGELVLGVPTVDLTVHFRAKLPPPGLVDGEFVLGVFRTREAHEGFVEEDGEIWSRDGLLLAQSRQLAIIG